MKSDYAYASRTKKKNHPYASGRKEKPPIRIAKEGKMKSLRPSMRENKRYLLVIGKNLKENIEKAILDFLGVLGMSKTGFGFVKSGGDSAIIYVNREMLNEVRAALCVWHEKMEVKKVSGTLKGLRGK